MERAVLFRGFAAAILVTRQNPWYLSPSAAQPIMEWMTQTTASANGWASRASSLLKRGLRAVTGRSQPESRPLGQPDRRLNRRLKVHYRARIRGESGWMRVRGVNMHAEGALVIASKPLAPQSAVFVHFKSFGLMGFGQVRHCTGRGPWSYAIGVEFPSPLMTEKVVSWQFHPVHQAES